MFFSLVFTEGQIPRSKIEFIEQNQRCKIWKMFFLTGVESLTDHCDIVTLF